MRARDRAVAGLVPRLSDARARRRDGTFVLDETLGDGACTPLAEASSDEEDGEETHHERVVAVKIMDRATCAANDRTRVSFVREVEVLRHITHPNIVSFRSAFSTPQAHCLVLSYVAGGELFDVLANDERWNEFSGYREPDEPDEGAGGALVRRVFSELARALGWMHGVGVVHRDVKLENILLTGPLLPLPSSHSPLVKLADFGLARFVDPARPFLSTRCGSEAYAAPELLLSAGADATPPAPEPVLSGSASSASSDDGPRTPPTEHSALPPRGAYDPRQTDAWAAGVVLFALLTRELPFDVEGDARRVGLRRIVAAEWAWPAAPNVSPSARAVVERILVRDPVRRARLVEVWDEPWLRGPGALPAPGASR